jgi:hypothetical protein
MRTSPAIAPLLATATVLAGVVALATAAEARKQQRYYYQPRAYQPYYYRPPATSYRSPRGYSWDRMVCEERAFAADPTGQYAGYPCWAREAFGRTPGGRGR